MKHQWKIPTRRVFFVRSSSIRLGTSISSLWWLYLTPIALSVLWITSCSRDSAAGGSGTNIRSYRLLSVLVPVPSLNSKAPSPRKLPWKGKVSNPMSRHTLSTIYAHLLYPWDLSLPLRRSSPRRGPWTASSLSSLPYLQVPSLAPPGSPSRSTTTERLRHVEEISICIRTAIFVASLSSWSLKIFSMPKSSPFLPVSPWIPSKYLQKYQHLAGLFCLWQLPGLNTGVITNGHLLLLVDLTRINKLFYWTCA